MKRIIAFFGALVAIAATPVTAADLPGYADVSCAAYSSPFSRPDATPASIRASVEEHFSLSIEVAESPSTIFNTRPRYVWARATKDYCGMAIGYLSAGELNDEAVMKCDCFYAQMRLYMQH